MKQFSLEYDEDYGADKRTGWTVVMDGRVVVQFRKWAILALVEAWLRRRKK